MLLVGDFVQNYIINGALQQASGIVGYDPATDTFTSNFGGVKLSSEVYCTVLKATPMFDVSLFQQTHSTIFWHHSLKGEYLGLVIFISLDKNWNFPVECWNMMPQTTSTKVNNQCWTTCFANILVTKQQHWTAEYGGTTLCQSSTLRTSTTLLFLQVNSLKCKFLWLL